MDYKKLNKDTYNKSAEFLNQAYEATGFQIGGRVGDIQRAFGYINKKSSDVSVIELGCGTGRDAKEILKYTHNYVGIDISEGMIQVAKEKAPNGDFRVCDIASFKFPNDIDIVFAFASLFHLNDSELDAVLKDIYKTLNSGGVFYISIAQLADSVYEIVKDTEFGKRYYFYHKPQRILELARNHGFEEIWHDEQTRQEQWFTIVLQKT